jgi:hypothetical protein
MPVPDFSPGEVLTAAAMDSIGLWLVKTQAVGTGVASVVVNDAFSSSFDSYRIVYTGGTASGLNTLQIRMGTAVTNGYYSQTIYASYATTTILANVADNNANQWSFVGRSGTAANHLSMNLYNPFLTTRTFFDSIAISASDMGSQAGVLQNATSYTGFTMIMGSGTLTGGTIRVYGYRN